ncbi:MULTISPECIES: hypothetical protein [Devosia]|uniref:hypothetical protein n=1 Tax=Devosia TaxID=46913 RepID=UPI0013001A70|nr:MULTISPECIES: hypothetical protein [Devosia]
MSLTSNFKLRPPLSPVKCRGNWLGVVIRINLTESFAATATPTAVHLGNTEQSAALCLRRLDCITTVQALIGPIN